ncbi:MAG: DUF2189 domain-containing protein [Gammaproteobacteria bacterium]|nr:DUF2189 domain-containing protein [Gammaproteobacteria bacterium]
MAATATEEHQPVATGIRIREISTSNVWQWLSAGWSDIQKAPVASLLYGANLAVLSIAITFSVLISRSYYLLPLLLAGFLLVAPFFGIGPYSLSQRLERGEKRPGLRDAISAWTGNSVQLLNMGIVLVVCLLVWAMVANLVFVLFQPGPTPANWMGFVTMLLGTWGGVQLLVVGTYAGGIIALVVFAISAVSIPMLIDRQVGVFEAINTSWLAVRMNIAPMLLWAAILVAIILSGFLTLYLGLIIGFPLAAHATWHAYRDLVVYCD